MKVSHEYFQNYNTRKIDYKKSTGLFILDGDAVPRAVIEAEVKRNRLEVYTQPRDLKGSSQLVFTPGRGDTSPLRRHLNEHPPINLLQLTTRISSPIKTTSRTSTANTAIRCSTASSFSYSPSKDEIKEAARREANSLAIPLYEVLQTQRIKIPKEHYNRLQTPLNETLTDQVNSIHEAKAEFYKHIYHDNNFKQQYQQNRNIKTAERLWNSKEKEIKSLQNSWEKEVYTAIPHNKQVLGLTPLRPLPYRQDKPHHIPVTNNVRRFDTKVSSTKTTNVVIWDHP